MNTSFQAVCEAAAAQWSVPALAAGAAVGDDVAVAAVGCAAGTLFRVASVTKPFTALLALGVLDPEEPTGVWPADVRVRHLLSHTSGFDCELAERDLARFGTRDGALAAAVAELPGVRRFLGVEEVWSYANTGYWLAGHLAAERLGVTYEEAVEERILQPFGLAATSFGEPELSGSGPDAGAGPYPRARRPSGGLVSNVADLLAFGRHLLADRASAQMFTMHGKPNGGVYGLGVFGQRVGGAAVWGHTGSYDGFQSSLLLVPDRSAVFAGLTNSGVGGKALYDVEDAFLERVVGARRPRPAFVDLAPAVRERYSGSYANSDGRYEVRVAGDGLAVTADGDEVALLPLDGQTFEVPSGPHVRERVDFPLPGLGRFGSRLAERVS
jgi:CubicO group peptidase (beta-lactamase class C family)